MTANMVLLEKITVGAAGASSVTFSSIPQTGYTDLVVKGSARSTFTVNPQAALYVSTNLSSPSSRRLEGNGSSAASYTEASSINASGSTPANSSTANTFGNVELYFPNYAGSTNKSLSIDAVGENNTTAAYATLTAGLFSATGAITSITLATDGNFAQYSTFYLYGVAKLGTTPAIVPYATGGDTIMTDGTYWYHTFLSSGTFTPAKALSCDYLVVAGGGGSGGGVTWNAGGGAGGLRSTVTATGGGGSLESKLSLGTSAYTVTVGAGGAGGSDGSNSVFSTITSTGGGAGGQSATGIDSVGHSGGSGGGGSANGYAGGAGTTNQGYAGGAGSGANNGGGGGAGSVGTAASGATPGVGGNGVAVAITGSSVTYAAGGAGGNTASNGTANTGNGAVGGGSASSPTTGGSGIVIVRYLV